MPVSGSLTRRGCASRKQMRGRCASSVSEKDRADRQEEEAILDLYKAVLGMQ
jgi:uncharacterized protein (UPF0335 family)